MLLSTLCSRQLAAKCVPSLAELCKSIARNCDQCFVLLTINLNLPKRRGNVDPKAENNCFF